MKIIKIRTLLVAGLAGGTGYVLGTRAGRSRFDELKVQADKLRAQADKMARNPQVRETMATVADKVKETAAKLPEPVADAVTKVAESAAAAGSSTATDDAGPLAKDVTSTVTPDVDPGGAAAGTPVSGVTTSDVDGPPVAETENSPGV